MLLSCNCAAYGSCPEQYRWCWIGVCAEALLYVLKVLAIANGHVLHFMCWVLGSFWVVCS